MPDADPGGLLPATIGLAGPYYFAGALALGLFYLVAAVRFWSDVSEASARRLLRASFVYLPAIPALLLLESDAGLNAGRALPEGGLFDGTRRATLPTDAELARHVTPAGDTPMQHPPVTPGKVAMWLFLATEVMFFTGLIGTYIVLRSGSPFGSYSHDYPRDRTRHRRQPLAHEALLVAAAVRPPRQPAQHQPDGGQHLHPDLLVGHHGPGALGHPRGDSARRRSSCSPPSSSARYS